MMFIIRAGLQILADHPRLYWKRDCTPGTDWFRFQQKVPMDRVWTAKDDAVTLTDMAGAFGTAPHDWTCPLVAFFGQSAMGDQRHHFLRNVVFDRLVAQGSAAHLGCLAKSLSTVIQLLR